jgi:hypothetical protein
MRRQSQAGLSLLEIALGLIMLAAIGIVLLPNFIRPGCGGQLTACKSNLKNLGTAMEMYSTDWSGHYPRPISRTSPKSCIPEHHYRVVEPQIRIPIRLFRLS